MKSVMMPGIDGFEICSFTKDNPATWKSPIIFVAAENSKG